MKVSVILGIRAGDPAQKYIGRALMSLAEHSATSPEMEVLCICEPGIGPKAKAELAVWEKAYPEQVCLVMLPEQEGEVRGSLGALYNIGLSYASGDYVLFLRPGDWLEPDAMEILMKEASFYGADLVRCEASEDFAGGYSLWENRTAEGAVRTEYEGCAEDRIRRLMNRPFTEERGILFSKEYLSGREVRFSENIPLPEDDLFWREQVTSLAGRTILLPEKLYHVHIDMGNQGRFVPSNRLRVYAEQVRKLLRLWDAQTQNGDPLTEYLKLEAVRVGYVDYLRLASLDASGEESDGYDIFKDLLKAVRAWAGDVMQSPILGMLHLSEFQKLLLQMLPMDLTPEQYAGLLQAVRTAGPGQFDWERA